MRGLFRDTGVVYEALTQDEGQLRSLIRNSHALFSPDASQREALAEAFHIFPTFLDESRPRSSGSRASRATRRAAGARPAAGRARAAADGASRCARWRRTSTLTSAASTSRSTSREERCRPCARSSTRRAPLFRSLGPFLSEFNPIFQWLELHQHLVSDFLGNGAGAPGTRSRASPERDRPLPAPARRDRRRVARHPPAPPVGNRGNAYLPPIIGGRHRDEEDLPELGLPRREQLRRRAARGPRSSAPGSQPTGRTASSGRTSAGRATRAASSR